MKIKIDKDSKRINVVLTEEESMDYSIYRNGELTDDSRYNISLLYASGELMDGCFSSDDINDMLEDIDEEDVQDKIDNDVVIEASIEGEEDATATEAKATTTGDNNTPKENVESFASTVSVENNTKEPAVEDEYVYEDEVANNSLEQFMIITVRMHNHIGCDGFPKKGTNAYTVTDYALDRSAMLYLYGLDKHPNTLSPSEKAKFDEFLESAKKRYLLKFTREAYKVSPEILGKAIPKTLIFRTASAKGSCFVRVKDNVMTEVNHEGKVVINRETKAPVFQYAMTGGSEMPATIARFLHNESVMLLTQV